jgi:hypothetical protein
LSVTSTPFKATRMFVGKVRSLPQGGEPGRLCHQTWLEKPARHQSSRQLTIHILEYYAKMFIEFVWL